MEISKKAKESLSIARLLIATLVLSVIISAAALAIARREPAGSISALTFGLLLAVTAPALVVGYLLLRRHLLGRARVAAATAGTERSEKVATLLVVQVLIGGAMAEGFGLLGAVGYYMTGQPAMLLACFFALLALIALIPTRNTLERFADAARYSG